MARRARDARIGVGPFLLLAVLTTAVTGGCANTHPSATTQPVGRNLGVNDRVFMVQGTSGFLTIGMRGMSRGLRDGGVDCRIDFHGWHAKRIPLNVVWNDFEHEAVELGAQSLVDRVEAHVGRYPEARVYLIGQSAGAEVCTRALELLHPDVGVEMAVMVGNSSWRWRRMGRALRAVDGGLYNIHSEIDVLLLAGTPAAGTTDRHNGLAAGFSGFLEPGDLSDADRALYRRKLVNVRWDDRLLKYGHHGHHVAGTNYPFVRDYIAPLLRTGKPPIPPNPEGKP